MSRMENEPKLALEQRQMVEPAWIRDISVANIMFTLKTAEDVAAVCAGEKIHCELCGVPVDLWPMSVIAKHHLETHVDAFTVQQIDGYRSILNQKDLSASSQSWLQIYLVARVSMRRRAWQLGYAVTITAPPAASKIRLA
jgi:hypothetical protein